MALSTDDESIVSEIKESIEEIDEPSDYSFDFDEDEGRDDDPVRVKPQRSSVASDASNRVVGPRSPESHPVALTNDDPLTSSLPGSPTPRVQAADTKKHTRMSYSDSARPIGLSLSHGQKLPETSEGGRRLGRPKESLRVLGNDGPKRQAERRDTTSTLPVQILALKARLGNVLQNVGPEDVNAAQMLTSVKREHAALRESLGAVEQELLTARRKISQDAALRLRAAQGKRARAEVRRAHHFEQLSEAKRVAAIVTAEAEAVRARLEDTATECRHTREMLEAARSSGVAAEERAVEYRKEAETAKDEVQHLRKAVADGLLDLEKERSAAAATARDAAGNLERCERMRELEASAARDAAEARERATEMQLKRLPEHQQQLLQAELDRVARWEERLTAEAASLQRREEAHKIEVEAWRVRASRMESESRARAEEDVARERACLVEARSALAGERGELLQRVARAEAIGQAKAAEVEAKNVEATETFRRVQAEKHALDTRGALLAPQFRALEEGRAALEGDRREAREETRRAMEEACRAREMEAGIVGREAAVGVKWEETAIARRAVKQMERNVAEEAEALSEQRKAVALARVHLHEQQMELVLQMSEIRKALDLMKRVERLGDRGARHLAIELGTLALDRGERRKQQVDNEDETCAPDLEPGFNGTLSATPVDVDSAAVPMSCNRGNVEKLSVPAYDDSLGTSWAMVTDTRGRDGNGAYADETKTREALEKVRSVLLASGGAMRGGGTPDASWERPSCQAWATRLQAAAIATGAL